MARPKVTPHQLDLWTGNMSHLYNALEGEIIRLIIRRLNTGHSDITHWQAQKLAELHLFNADVSRLLSKVTNVAEPELLRMFQDVGEGVVHDVDTAMPYPNKPVPADLNQIMRGYHNQVWREIDNYVNQTLLTTVFGAGSAQRAYQDVLNRTSAMFNAGIYTFEQAVEKSVQELAQRGIQTVLRDRGGNTWSLERYARTVLKSTLGNTYDAIRKERMSEYGVYTVLVTSHMGARAACSRIQGNVVDLREPHEIPPDSDYRSIYDAYWQAEYGEPGGHRGVNCRHLHVPFVPGVNTNNQPKYDAETNAQVAAAQNKQRRIEREIVKYKKNLMVSQEMGTAERAAYWKSMVRKRQGVMREHLAGNDKYLRRNYARERVYTPLDSLVRDFKYYD
ncbi:phage minor capsid protein [Planomicrobium sp. YIM 101495]|uniref:phage minor capsid protein n=1 Tax=Planomicrobium sp. YIM 101495 TaxID=2665160 RepID=UPI0012B728B7|nr:phage minor capsid protein [Planomicrobium sp. YIM 101495]MTD30167.1 capsid protein [Planomicrobium sp. YIM 101495]